MSIVDFSSEVRPHDRRRQPFGRNYTMDAIAPSFMLLPDFTFLPDGESVQLGTILPFNKQTKLPDPRRPLNVHSRIAVAKCSEQSFKPWSWDSESKTASKAGVTADVSLLTGIGGGLGGGLSRTRGLKIDCKCVTVKTFLADPQYIARAVADEFIQRLLRKIVRPPLYMVTGVMIAHGANITIKKDKSNDGNVHANADVTQTGVPLNVGTNFSVENSNNSTSILGPEQPFVLAYQLIRIRKKLSGDLETQDLNRHALYSGVVEDDRDEGEKLQEEFGLDAVDEKTTQEDAASA